MKQGTTPTHTFTLPFSADTVDKAKIIYAQNGKVILIKEGDEVVIKDYELSCRLSQEDTFLFDEKYNVQIQVRVLTTAGDSLVSQIKTVCLSQCLDREVFK